MDGGARHGAARADHGFDAAHAKILTAESDNPIGIYVHNDIILIVLNIVVIYICSHRARTQSGIGAAPVSRQLLLHAMADDDGCGDPWM